MALGALRAVRDKRRPQRDTEEEPRLWTFCVPSPTPRVSLCGSQTSLAQEPSESSPSASLVSLVRAAQVRGRQTPEDAGTDGLAVRGGRMATGPSLATPHPSTVRAQAPGADLRHSGSRALISPYIAIDPKPSSSGFLPVTWRGWSK